MPFFGSRELHSLALETMFVLLNSADLMIFSRININMRTIHLILFF